MLKASAIAMVINVQISIQILLFLFFEQRKEMLRQLPRKKMGQKTHEEQKNYILIASIPVHIKTRCVLMIWVQSTEQNRPRTEAFLRECGPSSTGL